MGEERYRQQVEKEISDLQGKLKKKDTELGRTKDRLRMTIMREAETNSKYEKLVKEHKKCQEYMKKHNLGEMSNPLYSGSTMRASKKKKKRKSSKRRKRSKKR